jgi:hypothetical protein
MVRRAVRPHGPGKTGSCPVYPSHCGFYAGVLSHRCGISLFLMQVRKEEEVTVWEEARTQQLTTVVSDGLQWSLRNLIPDDGDLCLSSFFFFFVSQACWSFQRTISLIHWFFLLFSLFSFIDFCSYYSPCFGVLCSFFIWKLRSSMWDFLFLN